MVSRPQVFAIDVATSECCRDLFSCLLMSRPLTDVATLISLQADVATFSDAVLMSRPLVFFFINSWFLDLEFLSRPARFAFNYSSVATGVLSSRP